RPLPAEPAIPVGTRHRARHARTLRGVIRDGTLDDIPRAAALRQRAWAESIVTEEGMRHWIAGVPARAELALFAWEEDRELRGWATAARNWWSSDPRGGILA